MNLIIDAGNTAVKLAVFEEGQLVLTNMWMLFIKILK